MREVTTELYRRWLEESTDPEPSSEAGSPETSWLFGWAELGRRISERAVDPRTTRQILVDDRG